MKFSSNSFNNLSFLLFILIFSSLKEEQLRKIFFILLTLVVLNEDKIN